MTYKILGLGAAYGSLMATKMLWGGHSVHLVCLPAEAELINAKGARVRLPIRGRAEPIEINTKDLAGKLTAGGPAGIDLTEYDLVCLAMQEPQYRLPGVRELLDDVARSRKPCMSIMNMPPLPYLRRIPALASENLDAAFTDASVWRNFSTDCMTLCSPDPQAIRPPGDDVNVLQVTLPTNFKAARFVSDAHTQIIRDLQSDIESIRYDTGNGEKIELPVKLKVHDSIFVPLAKWSMLLTGNYRCVTKDAARTIKEAVHSDLDESRRVFNWVRDLCISIGAKSDDLVTFEKYAEAAKGLVRPSSAARALFAGAPYIERVDRLVQLIGAQRGLRNPIIDATVAIVDARLQMNRQTIAT